MINLKPLVLVLILSGCSTNELGVTLHPGPPRNELPKFSLTEIVSRGWQHDGRTVTLLRQVDLPTSDSQWPDCKAMIFGLPESGTALCIEFYANDSSYLDDRTYCLMKRDWGCPPTDLSVTREKQGERVFINVEGTREDGGSAVHRAYGYELTPQFRLIPTTSEFVW